MEENLNFAIGVGAEYKRLSVEFRYYIYTNQEFTPHLVYWKTDYKRLSLSMGYEIFKMRSKGK